MSAKIREIRAALEEQQKDWNWEFSYAPLPGNQRIKVTAVSKEPPKRARTIYLGAGLVDQLPPSRIAQSLLTLLPTIPEARENTTQQEPPASDAKSHYDQLRKIYAAKVQELRETSTSHLSKAGKGVTQLFNQFSRKSTAA